MSIPTRPDFLHRVLQKLQRGQMPIFGHSRSKALNATPRKWELNRQIIFLYPAGGRPPERLFLSVRAIRSLKRTLEKHPGIGRLGSRPQSPRDA